jgi:small subunit ribosomal protein S16
MLSIKLSRIGKKKYPVYSLIVVEKSKDPWGDYTEKLGTYNPHTKTADLKADRISYWIGIGAQPTATVNNLLVAQGILKGEKVRAGKSQPGKKRSAEIAAAKKAEEDAKAKVEADKLAAEEAAKAAEEAAKNPAPVEETAPVAEEATPAEVVETPTETAPEAPAEEAKTE